LTLFRICINLKWVHFHENGKPIRKVMISMKLSFSTLSCPGWSWDRILDQAVSYGFDGIEVRGVRGELDNEKIGLFQGENIPATVAQLKSRGLAISCLDTSCTFLSNDVSFAETLRSGKAAVDIAKGLGAPCIRVFGDRIPQGMGEQAAIALVAEGMQSIAAYAEGNDVMVLQETHGNFAESRMLLAVFDRVKSPAAGVLWDIANPYEFGETVDFTWSRLKCLIRHVHVKDIIMKDGGLAPCLPGRGRVPIGEAVRALREAGYEGWLSFEWEKRWHTSIEEPEVALPAFMEHIKRYL
jgi:sugar phosphate isomerase/epimerase